MDVTDFLALVAYKEDMVLGTNISKVWKSKFDDSYITHVGLEEDIKFLADREITDELTHGVGYSPKDSKWYGWSHRAIYGFCIGSICEKGNCHYHASNIDDEIEDAIRFWSDEDHEDVTAQKVKDGEILVSWKYGENTPNEKLRGSISSAIWNYDTNFGKGEWIAETLMDAKQMAIDFNNGVS